MKIRKIDTFYLLMEFTRLKINFYETGTLEKQVNGKTVKTHDFFKTDNLTDTQKAGLLEKFPSLEFFGTRSEYAPALKACLIASPKAARIRELNK